MFLNLASLNSGSNGNCYYIGNSTEAVLIDAGISRRETESRMRRLGLSLKNVRAIFISHEHSDHIRGADVLSRIHNIPVYMSPVTYLSSRVEIEPALLRILNANEEVKIGGFSVFPLPKKHDGSDPYSFTLTYKGITAGVFTDIGEACNHVIGHFSRCHAAFLEANYDEDMLEKGRYPLYLKRRIRSNVGHLSNVQALDLFMQHRSPRLQLLVLSHLSEQNNRPQLVSSLFAPHANGTRIAIASRYEESELFRIAL